MIIGLGIGIPFNLNQISRLYSPLSLFANGEQGAWYDPSDLSTLYQDAAGTTPVTAVEQPVGLMLDKSRGLVLGPELVVNGTFDSATGWALGSGWVISDGSASRAPAASASAASAAITLLNPATYLIEIDITVTAGSFRVSFTGGAFTNETPDITGFGVFKYYVSNTTSSTTINLNARQSSTNVTVRNISVRELPGAHAFQTTATSRPVLSARVNLLTKTEQFDDAAWFKNAHTITGNSAIAPDGTMTADKLVAVNGTDPNQVGSNGLYASVPLTANVPYLLSFYAKAAEFNILRFRDGGQSGAFLDFNLTTGAVTNGNTSRFISPVAEPVGSGWHRISFTTGSITSSVAYPARLGQTGDGTSGIYIWGASLVPSNQSSLPYQRVNTATDYDSDPTKFPRYLRCDGIDDGMVTGTITPGTDKAQVFAGVRKLSDAAEYSVILELSTVPFDNAGTIQLNGRSRFVPAGDFGFASKGTVFSATAASPYVAPITNVLTGLGDISGDRATLRINGTQAAQSTADQGTGNYLAYPLYLFRRGGTTLPFNGHFYGGIIRFGPNLPIETIQQTEAYMAAKTGVTL